MRIKKTLGIFYNIIYIVYLTCIIMRKKKLGIFYNIIYIYIYMFTHVFAGHDDVHKTYKGRFRDVRAYPPCPLYIYL